jgi:hypothetical protein
LFVIDFVGNDQQQLQLMLLLFHYHHRIMTIWTKGKKNFHYQNKRAASVIVGITNIANVSCSIHLSYKSLGIFFYFLSCSNFWYTPVSERTFDNSSKNWISFFFMKSKRCNIP